MERKSKVWYRADLYLSVHVPACCVYSMPRMAYIGFARYPGEGNIYMPSGARLHSFTHAIMRRLSNVFWFAIRPEFMLCGLLIALRLQLCTLHSFNSMRGRTSFGPLFLVQYSMHPRLSPRLLRSCCAALGKARRASVTRC